VEAIALDLLELVCGGGESTTEVGVGPFRYRSSQTDWSKCVDTARDLARRQHPSTAASWNPFSRDSNAGARATAEAANIGTMCGTPPTP
jgi:hypothetical protein